jgi:chorismate dehydratase
MLKLGHIIYSNCFPPHAGIVTKKVTFPFSLVEGIPTELNRLLWEGGVDIAPSSSIEYAMHPGKYLIFPRLSITSRNKVMSIIFQSRVPLEKLDKKTVALTTASATSIILLRILLEQRYQVRPYYMPYQQGIDDPATQADAFLTIGDLAITQAIVPGFAHQYDLGELWHEFTRLPFVFALWQMNYKIQAEDEFSRLYDILMTSKSYGLSHLREFACSYEKHFNIPADVLVRYWTSFSYDFGEEEQKGLLSFYRYAAEIGAIPAVPELKFWTKAEE